jgi:hypothetical protein
MKNLAKLALPAGLVLSLSACGPKGLLQIGVQSYAQNVHLGAQSSPAAPPPPLALGAEFEPGLPGFLVPPFSLGQSSGPALPCPAAPPFAGIALEATPDVEQPPKPGIYHYRQAGSVSVKGLGTASYGPSTSMQVTRSYVGRLMSDGQHDSTDKSIYWDVLERTYTSNGGPDSTVDYTYQLIPGQEIDIYAITVTSKNGSKFLFQPALPNTSASANNDVEGNTHSASTNGTAAQFEVFPMTNRPTWTDSAGDPADGATFDDDATVGGKKDAVDACGTLIDAYHVDMGSVSQTGAGAQPPGGCIGGSPPFQVCVAPSPVAGQTPAQQNEAQFVYASSARASYNIDGWYDVATEYGGLLVAEDIVETAQDGSWTIHRQLTINSVTPG